MATAAVARLQRVLELEERQQWRNRVVMGGLQAMAARWQEDARAEMVDGALVQRAVALMVKYGSSDAAQRPDLAARLRHVLEGEEDAAAVAAPDESAAPAAALFAQELMNVPAEPPAAPPAPPAAPAAPAPAAKPPPAPKPSSKPAAAPPQPGAAGGDDLPAMALGAVYIDDEFAAPSPPKPKTLSRTSNRPPRQLHELLAPPTILQGVGSSINEQLQRLGVNTVQDLLWHLPFRHEDYSALKTIAQLQPGETVTVVANLWQVNEKSVGINRKVVEGVFTDSTGTLTARWWNKWIVRQLPPIGTTVRLSGKIGLFMGKKTIEGPLFEDADRDSLETGRLVPVYALTEGLAQKKLRQLIRQALEDFAALLPDPLPARVRAEYGLLDLGAALWGIHFPDDAAQLDAARRRLAFEELFYVQLGVQQRRRTLRAVAAQALDADRTRLEPFVAALPFALTDAQVRVLDEVVADLGHSVPMTRLVQGDVGSGKTAVAAGGMYVALLNGVQSVLLAPTQILAEQHHRSISRLLEPLARPDGAPIEVALLTGRVTGLERERILSGLREGAIDIVVGTTALIQEGVEFARLGLVVVDEQHRFGVEQRGALRSQGGTQPHLLVMSATPIPRSLALTIFGDLDVSTLDEMPPGRTPVKTVLFRRAERERVYGFVRNEAQAGRQAFIVYPLVDANETLDAGAATQEYETLRTSVFPNLRLALLHGQMKGSEKDAIMSAFAAGEADVLVSTSVIEVGIDVPNATVIIVEDAERFGLAQLHQFRGRVGRGQFKSYCVLVSSTDTEAALERLHILESTNDGFVLAEKDLELRGPGEFLGTRQSGLPELRIAQFSDIETLRLARDAAQRYFEQDPDLANDPALAQQVQRFWRGEGDIN